MSQRRVQLLVRGRVQGVFYRATALSTAARLGVTGYVRNSEDGSVEIVAEGRPDAIDAMIAWARGGPGGARVDEVEVHDERPTGEFASFRIVG